MCILYVHLSSTLVSICEFGTRLKNYMSVHLDCKSKQLPSPPCTPREIRAFKAWWKFIKEKKTLFMRQVGNLDFSCANLRI